MKEIVLVAVLALCCSCRGQQTSGQPWSFNDGEVDSEIFMTATQLITSKGYPCENYWITTKDGYILNILRIKHGRHENETSSAGTRPVVVLQHGLLGAATNFLTNLVNQSLAYILADAGAEVWLGNSRGNTYSTNHTHLDPSDIKFWQFSWGDMAKYDLPAMINFIIHKSRVSQVYYVGHSQGTTIGFAQFGEDPKLASRIKHFFALAPVAKTSHSKSPLAKLAPFAKNISEFYNMFHHGRVKLNETIQKFLAMDFCTDFGSYICTSSLFMLCGFDFKSFNSSRLPVYVAHSPAGTSVNTFLHWAQGTNSGLFQKYDYGSKIENIKHYGQATPPLYTPSKIKIPVTVFRGGVDWMTATVDSNWLLAQISGVHDVFIDRYAHLDFIWAVDAPEMVYKKIVDTVLSS